MRVRRCAVVEREGDSRGADDPFVCHAAFVALVWEDRSAPISAIDIVRFGRLIHNVRKDGLLCSLDEHGAPSFVTIRWSGFA